MQAVQTKTEFGICHISLEGEDNNSLSQTLLSELISSIEKANKDVSCRAILLTAKGKYFCSGLKLEMLWTTHKMSVLQNILHCLWLLYTSEKVTMVFVEGEVIGGGIGLVAASDIAFVSESATFQLSEVVVGMIPAMIAPFILRRISLGKLRYLAVSSQKLNATEAERIGLIDHIVADSSEVKEQLQRILYSNPKAIAESKGYFDVLCNINFAKEKQLALAVLEKWLQDEGILAEMKEFTEGFSPSWFQKYQGDIS